MCFQKDLNVTTMVAAMTSPDFPLLLYILFYSLSLFSYGISNESQGICYFFNSI